MTHPDGQGSIYKGLQLATLSVEIPVPSDGKPPVTTIVQLLPAGDVVPRDARKPWRLTDTAAVVEATRRYAGGTQLVVDYDHGIDKPAGRANPGLAAGWITALQATADGIWGVVEWTAKAAAHIAEREYRYISPVFEHREDGTITRLVRAALLNNPALDLKALCRSEDTLSMGDDLGAGIRRILDMPDADDAAVLARVAELVGATKATAAAASQAGASHPVPSGFVPIGDYQRTLDELKAVRTATALAAAERQIDASGIFPADRVFALELAAADQGLFQKFMGSLAVSMCAEQMRSLTGRRAPAGAYGQGVSPDGALTNQQREVCAAMGIAPDAFIKAKG